MTAHRSDLNLTRLDRESLEARLGMRIAARLGARSEVLPHDISERLRFARERALERARASGLRAAPSASSVGGGTLALGGRDGQPGWWWRLASLAPLVGLVAGLVLIQMQHDDDQIQAAADIDAALLTDDLPPSAYADAGFAEFLRVRDN